MTEQTVWQPVDNLYEPNMNNYFWHFVQVDEDGTPRLGHDDGREVRVGETLTVTGEPVFCGNGLHASKRVLDAMRYVQSSNLALCLVTLGGTVLHDDDKAVATERTVVAMLDVDATSALLRDFARWCALQVIHLWNAPDVVRQYLETGDESLRAAAGDAARAASRIAFEAASRAAIKAAAGATAKTVARAMAWNAAGDTAWAAAGAASKNAAEAASWNAARAASWNAAWDASGDGAWDTARDAQSNWLEAEARKRMSGPQSGAGVDGD